MLTERTDSIDRESSRSECAHLYVSAEARVALRSLLAQVGEPIGLSRSVVDGVVSRAHIRHLSAGRTVFSRGSRARRIHFLVVGSVRLVSGTAVVHLLPAGSFLDLPLLLDMDGHHRIGAITHEACVMAEVDLADWQHLVATLPTERMRRFAAHACDALADLVAHRTVLAHLRLRERVRRQLTVLARDFGRPHAEGTSIEVQLTHEHLAEMIVASRANVTRAIKSLANDGWLLVDGRQVVVRRGGLAS